MEDVKVCRVCLILDVKMYDLEASPYDLYFRCITGSNVLSIVNAPPHACYECILFLKKFYFFKQKCLRSQAVLFGLLDGNGEIPPSQIKKIDRKSLLLTSNLAINESQVELHEDFDSKDDVKEETLTENVGSNFDVEVSCIKKEEVDVLAHEKCLSSDVDDPYSPDKEDKIEDSDDDSDWREETEIQPIETVTCESLPIPTKRLPTKKSTGLKKTLKKTITKRKTSKATSKKTVTDIESELINNIAIVNVSLEDQLEEINKRKLSTNFLNSPFQCHLCYKGFIDTDTWKHHSSKHDPSAGDMECPICKCRFKTRRALQRHSIYHEKKYVCKSCPHTSSNMAVAKKHQGWHKGVTYECKFCDDSFTVFTSYMSHVRIKHPSEFICGICGYSFISKLGLAMHKTLMHKDVLAKGEDDVAEDGPYCEECDVKFVSTDAFKRHMIMSTKHTRNTKTINGCRTCGETFENSEELKLHHRKAHAIKKPKNYGQKINWPAKCEYCSEEMANGREHWAHFRRVHPDRKYPIQKNYVCDVCGKSFKNNAFLVYHKRTHTEERLYQCAQCDKSFYTRTNLQLHQRAHSDTRPYPCAVCCKAFKCKSALKRHYIVHSGQKPYECELCGKSFAAANTRKNHISTVHFKQPAQYVSRRRKKSEKKSSLLNL